MAQFRNLLLSFFLLFNRVYGLIVDGSDYLWRLWKNQSQKIQQTKTTDGRKTLPASSTAAVVANAN